MSKRKSKIPADELPALYSSGLGIRRLASHFGMSRGAIKKRLTSLDISIESSRITVKKDRGTCAKCLKPLVKGQYKFCSRSCSASIGGLGKVRNQRGMPENLTSASKIKTDPIVRICITCGEEHYNRLFCSQECYRISIRKSEQEKKERRRITNLLGVRRYQARRANQIPPDADHDKIRAIYLACPPGYEVDHIIPIAKGGSHHQDNLQYLTLRANRQKGSKMPHELLP